MVREFEEGIGDTGIKGRDHRRDGTEKNWVPAQEERVCRAAGRAQQRTGFAITTHSLLGRVGRDKLRLFIAEGADPGRVVIGHCDWYPDLDYYLELIGIGASVEFDIFGHLDA